MACRKSSRSPSNQPENLVETYRPEAYEKSISPTTRRLLFWKDADKPNVDALSFSVEHFCCEET